MLSSSKKIIDLEKYLYLRLGTLFEGIIICHTF